jgi:hypothetical protein
MSEAAPTETAGQRAKRRVSIVPHTHWDREWYATFQTFRLSLVDLLDELLPALEADLGYAHFLLDGQMAAVDDYLAVRPAAEDVIRRLVSSGRVAVGPWYTLPDEFCVSGETLVRDLELGLARAARLGGGMEVGYLPDMFGHVAQMPQLLRLFGFDTAVVWRGVPTAIDRTSFWWSAPDGSTVRAEYLWHGYGNGADIPDDANALLKRVSGLLDTLEPMLAGELLFMNGTDHQRPQPWLARVVAEANAISDDVELVVCSLASALASSAATLGGAEALPRWTGELRSGARANLLMGVASNRVDVKQAAARAERALERRAEPLSALWLAPQSWPAALLDAAWLEMARNAAHDSSCACSVDDVCATVLHRYREAAHIGEGLAARALAALADRMQRAGAIVVNPVSRTRGGIVEILVPGEGPITGGQVVEDRPTVIADRTLTAGDAWSWLLGFRSQRIAEDTYVNRAEVDDGNGAIELTLHCEDRLVDNLLVDDIKADVNARLAARPGTSLHLRILQPPSRRLLWRVEDVPGFGWRRWDTTPSAAPAVTVTGDPPRLSNGLVSVTFDTSSATFALDGLTGLGRLVDGGDHGDTYNYSPPDHDLVVDQPASATVTVVETGPLRGRIRMVAIYDWPARIDDEARARMGSTRVTVTTVVELRAGEQAVRVTHDWDNRGRDHRVRAVLPLPALATTSTAECAFAVVERGVHAEGGPTERPLATSFSRRFVRAGGLTVVHDGLLEYELTTQRGTSVPASAGTAGELSLTLLRATGMLSRVEMTNRPLPAGPPVVTDGAQLLGPVRVCYAVCTDPGVDPYGLADDILVPLDVAVAHGGGPEAAEQSHALEVTGAEVSAVRREAGGQLTLRLFNPTPAASSAMIAGRSGWVIDLRGHVVGSFIETVGLGPWQIATLRLA